MTENSAEREAERILQAAAEEIQAEECPQGRECGVHFRVDEAVFDDEDHYGRMISYVGEYVVVTEDNHVFSNPAFLIKLLMGQIPQEDLPGDYETSIYHVGSEGTIGQLSQSGRENIRGALRYAKAHNKWKEFASQHHAVVSALTAGLIDVSQPLEWED